MMKFDDNVFGSARLAASSSQFALGSDPSSVRPNLFSHSRTIILAAHPDDETIGASSLLGRLKDVWIVYLTDGAPRDSRLWSSGWKMSREEYSTVRRQEACEALQLVNVPEENIWRLECPDQEAVFQLPYLIDGFATVLRDLKPDLVITHAYEGGHPDHDCAALVARVAMDEFARTSSQKIVLSEMTSYSGMGGKLSAGAFLSGGTLHSDRGLGIPMSLEELTRKQEMLRCFRSQSAVLERFLTEPERLRESPRYDFEEPPHRGQLWYESLGWPMTGERWRHVTGSALSTVGENTCR